MLKMDAKRRKYHNRQNKIHDARNLGILNIEYFMNVFQGQGFFICHIIVIQGITRSEMQSNQVRSVDSAKQ